MTRSHPTTEDERAPFVHQALLYRDTAGYLGHALTFIYDGLSADEPVMVAAPPANVTLLRERLGPFADEVQFHDMTAAGRNPARIIPWVLSAFMDQHRGRPVRIIGEPIWAGRSKTEYPVCVQHEAMINIAFTGREARILCPYDAKALSVDVITDAEQTHPVMVDHDGTYVSRHYDPHGVTRHYNRPLPEPPAGATTTRFELHELSLVRRIAAATAMSADLPPDRVEDVRSAVNEVATNSIMHAGGAGTLRTWVETDRIVCEVRDFGRITDPMIGRLRPEPGAERGHGLVLVHYLTDLVQTHTSLTGTATRLHFLR